MGRVAEVGHIPRVDAATADFDAELRGVIEFDEEGAERRTACGTNNEFGSVDRILDSGFCQLIERRHRLPT